MARSKRLDPSAAEPLPPWVPQGWYADPLGEGAARYWDGEAWRTNYRDAPGPQPVPAEAEGRAAIATKAPLPAPLARRDAASERQAAKDAALERERTGIVGVSLGVGPSHHDAWLFPRSIEVRTRSYPLTPATSAEVHIGGRKLFLTVHDPGWDLMLEYPPRAEANVRLFASQINHASQALAPDALSQPTAPASTSVTDTIRELGRLRDQGILTPEEFAEKKAELLQRL